MTTRDTDHPTSSTPTRPVLARPADGGWRSARLQQAGFAAVPSAPGLVKAKPALERAARAGQVKLAVALAGQGAGFVADARALIAESPAAAELFDALASHLDSAVAALPAHEREAFDRAFAAVLKGASSAERSAPRFSAPGALLVQVMRWASLREQGLKGALSPASVTAFVGHSAGALGAGCLASLADLDDVAAIAEAAAPWLDAALWLGLRMEQGAPPPPSPSALASSTEAGLGRPTAMAAVDGLLREELEQALAASPDVVIGGAHGWNAFTLAGRPDALEQLRLRLVAADEAHEAAKKKGRAADRGPAHSWDWVPVATPFHHPSLKQQADAFAADLTRLGVVGRSRPLHVPVTHPTTGALLATVDEVVAALPAAILTDALDWPAALASALDEDTIVLDLGPTDTICRISAKALRGKGATLLAAALDDDVAALLDPHVLPSPRRRPYAAWAPRLSAGDAPTVVNRFTALTGCPPFVLPGMTPTTVDAPIVVAAANAGYVAELAGGGQVTEAILRARLDEILEGLEPGRGVVFNALYLDPYLWGLHFADKGLVFRLKAEGYPILGVTVSAGVPPKDEALLLLDRLHAAGMTLNAFKPGTSAQTADVLDIARAHPAPLFVHLEGGRAGGHHSFEGLDDLLLRNYDAIRAVDNAVLVVGGGIGTEAKATTYLDGRWAEAYGAPRMPVDGVLLGTRLMATLEAKTSPAVKAALVAAEGDEGWPLDGQVKGGVLSGRSGLNASIYYLDNAAARVGALLDEVAGDEEKVAARRDEIVNALNATAKPYFGDVGGMTYEVFLRRFVELTAVGDGSVYADGVWPDLSFRERFEALFDRVQERLASDEEPRLIGAEASSDAPLSAIDRLRAAHPLLASRRVHPEDERFFLEVCRRRGKPVTFVPVIDADVRRWYKADSLWQSHRPGWAAEQVLAIPGPASVAAITQADEPVGEVLDGFHRALVGAIDDVAPASRPALATRVLDIEPEGAPLVKRLLPMLSGDLYLALAEANAFEPSGRCSPNPLRAWLQSPAAAQAEVVAGDAGATGLRLVDEQQRTLLLATVDARGLTTALVVRADDVELTLPVHLSIDNGRLFWDRAAWMQSQRELFASLLLDGRPLASPEPFAWCDESTVLSTEAVEAYRRATGGEGRGTPLSFAFALAWPAVFRALAGAPGDLFRLVHETNEVERTDAWPPRPGERLMTAARVDLLEDELAGRRVGTVAVLRVERDGERVDLATVRSRFFIRQSMDLNVGTRLEERRVDAAVVLTGAGDVAWLDQQPWCRWTSSAAPASLVGVRLRLIGELTSQVSTARALHGGEARLLDDAGRVVAELSLSQVQQPAGAEHPLDVVADLFAAPSTHVVTDPVPVATASGAAPSSMAAYAWASGDKNPLHLDDQIARVAGFEAPLVHGMWTCAWAAGRIARVAAGGDHDRMTSVRARFVAPLLRGASLEAAIERVGQARGGQSLSLEVAADGAPVLALDVDIAPTRTAYVYPGQGTHAPGMGMEGYARSTAARDVWDAADAHTRRALGFSLLDVVRDNPRELWVRGERFQHPKGVLYLTQFTQVALAVLAVAQTRELENDGLLVEDALFGGHSLGEYSALAALGGVLDLHGVVEIVYARGLTMDRLIARGADGSSPYAMGVIRPHLAGLDEARALQLIERVAAEVGAPLEVVNHNIRGRQYTVTGAREALDLLAERVGAAYVEVPGIDVPFHSTLLRPGVPAFRERLDAVLPERIDAHRLVGRYLPNLVGRPFAIDEAFFSAVEDACPCERVAVWRDALEQDELDEDSVARDMLIELLAWQFASPVRWIATQDVLFGLGGQARVPPTQVIEIGPVHAPTLVGMARSTLRDLDLPITVRHAEVDRERLAGEGDVEHETLPVAAAQEQPAGAAVDAVDPAAVAAPQPPVATPAASGPAASDDADLLHSGVVTLLALLTKKGREEIALDASIDKLVGGNSARRNQILADLGQELGAKSLDGANELPLGELLERLRPQASGYRGEGGYLKPQIDQALGRAFGAAGLDRSSLLEVLSGRGVPSSHQIAVLHDVALSARGLGTPLPEVRDRATGVAAIEDVAARYAARQGFALSSAAATGGGELVDAAAVAALQAEVEGRLEAGGRALAQAFGVDLRPTPVAAAPATSPASEVLFDEIEHGDGYADVLVPQFDSHKHVAFTSAWAWGRRDLLDIDAAVGRGETVDDARLGRVAVRMDATAVRMGRRLAERQPTAAGKAVISALVDDAERRLDAPLPLSGEVALVTGAGPGAIALAVVARLLEGGARVIATTSSYGPERLAGMKRLYQDHAAIGAELHIVPCNQGAFRDIDALVAWLGEAQKEVASGQERILKPPMAPTLLVPFAALPETADLVSMGARQAAALRVNVLGVERLVARSAELARRFAQIVDVILPLSPNHGHFGGDGAYGEAKAALEVLLNRRRAEASAWGDDVRLVGAEIGWVRGTGLMRQNDAVAVTLAEAGLRTFTTDEMADLLIDAWRDARRQEARSVRVDLSGGLGSVEGLGDQLRQAHAQAAAEEARERRVAELGKMFGARTGRSAASTTLRPRGWEAVDVPAPTADELATFPALDHLDLEEVVVACGFGEVGPYGSARTRWEVEQGGPLAVEAVAELAWMCGLIVPDAAGEGFVLVEGGAPVNADDLAGPLQQQLLERSGVRVTEPETVGFDPDALVTMLEVRLDRDFTFPVPSRAVADALVAHAPEHTTVAEDGGQVWVTRQRGAALRVPSSMNIRRHVSGQLPRGWDPVRLGIPEAFAAQVDPVTLYCLVSTAEAFLSAGLEPEEIYEVVHPGRVGVTVGTGIGGMKKLMRLHRDAYDGEERQNDTLQETLINVIGGYIVQSFLGSYGPMSFPVGACATAGLSVADGMDLIRRGRADVVVAGGADDLSEAGLVGFGDMGATVDTRDLEARGIPARKMSRPSDTRRRGFVEAQGAGVVLLVRASVAAELGLPVRAVVAYAGSSGDGIQRSVPAPGQGALIAGAGHADAAFDDRRRRLKALEARRDALVELLGDAEADACLKRARRELAHHPETASPGVSPLAAALGVLGLVGDDVAIVSKHDSSTLANDENEARLHARLAEALGRTPDLPLPTVSQKALTGHPKGAAAAWQLNGLMQMMASGVLPPHPSLDDVSAELREIGALVPSDRPRVVPRSSLKAGLVTTLGFGHVSALVCLAHPFLFWRMLSGAQQLAYRQRMQARMADATRKLQSTLAGDRPLVTLRDTRPFATGDEEAAFLLDPSARLARGHEVSA
jgi:enoyl reductase-like protein/3-oxoacyl-ACP reductase-like protein/3-oxoacyl-(acyl-carrier-protein) synthase/acyl dehydratase